jgi:polyferredoxin
MEATRYTRTRSGVRSVQVLMDAPRTRLARAGDWMARNRARIALLQWAIVLLYFVLVAVPAFLPLPPEDARMADNLTRFAQFAFWGVWWPFVIASMLLVGRFWCGVMCPEGALTEFAGRPGKGLPIPRWMRWPGWPLVGFLGTTLYGQLISVYEYPGPVLVILGGSTVAAIAVGIVYGRGKRVWCRYLCPVTGVFALLARLAPLHFKVDRAAWDLQPAHIPAVDCPPLLNVHALASAAQCHSCGRCSGHRDAVALSLRWPGSEIVASKPGDVGHYEALLLLYGMLGFAIGAFQWTLTPGFVAAKQWLATWLVEQGILWPLASNAPWWVLTHYAEVSDVFSWLDGAGIVAWLVGSALLVGGFAHLAAMGAARLARADWKVLALALVPMAAANLFLGLSMLTLTQLRSEGLVFHWLPQARLTLLAVAWLGCVALSTGQLRRAGTPPWRSVAAATLVAAAAALPVLLWVRALDLLAGM